MKKAAGVYAVFLGISMIAQWAMFILSNQVPELQSEPVRISFHLAAEAITAMLLIAGGIGVLRNLPWAKNIYLLAMGFVLYSMTVSPGYFAQKGQWLFVLMFAFLSVFAVFFSFIIMKQSSN